MSETAKSRNQTVDILRGIAMLMVVLGHTMTGCTVNSWDSILFNVIWTLQMPLFILISGYVTRYSKSVLSFKSYGKFVWKRTLAYLLPWVVWTFVIRGIIFQQHGYLDIKNLPYHMDSGYWFLFTVWTISMIFGFSQLISEKICLNKNKFVRIAVLAISYVLGMGILGGIGRVMGLSFCCIKLTLYYMPFYFIGYLFGQLQPEIDILKCGKSLLEIAVAACLVVWLALMQRYNFYEIGNSGFCIILRAIASLSGCIAVCGLVSKLIPQNRPKMGGGLLQYVGVHSLEIYLIHYMLLSMMKAQELPLFGGPQGVLLVALNYVVTMSVAIAIIAAVNTNRVLRIVLFGKFS